MAALSLVKTAVAATDDAPITREEFLIPSQRQEITVPENGEVQLDFILGIKGLPKI
jgi:hypothetical protein